MGMINKKTSYRLLSLGIILAMLFGFVPILAYSAPDDIEEGVRNIYHVDPNGDDANDGLSPGSAWKTLAKASTQVLGADATGADRLLLKAGGVWNGERLLVQNSRGNEDYDVVVGRYGEGPDPIINGRGVNRGQLYENAAVLIRNCAYITVERLDITNSPNDSFPGSTSNPSSLLYLIGLYVDNNGAGNLPNVTIRNNTVHDVSSRMAGGGSKNTGGISVAVRGNVNSQFSNLQIIGNEIYNVSHEGIYLQSSRGTRRLTSGSAATTENWYGWDDTYIAHNYVHHTAGDGITVINTNNALVEYNLLDNVASDDYDATGNPSHAGLWMWDANNVHLRYNEVMNTGQGWTSSPDGMAFDFDYGTQNCLFEYNFSHGNDGGCLMVCPDNWTTGTGRGGVSINHVFRYNISVNDRKAMLRLISSYSAEDEVHIYNNTFYWSQPLWQTPVRAIQTNGNYQIYNNIFCGPGPGFDTTHNGIWPTNARTVYSNNLLWGGAELGYNIPGRILDPNAVIADPKFVDTGAVTFGTFDFATGTVNLGSVPGFKLKAGSPAIGAGMAYMPAPDKIPSSYYHSAAQKVPQWIEDPTMDYFGNPIVGTPTIGAYHYTVDKTPRPDMPDSSELIPLYDAIVAACDKLDNPPVPTGVNDPNAWMTVPLQPSRYQYGGSTAAEYTAMNTALNNGTIATCVGEVEAAIEAAAAYLALDGDPAALAAAAADIAAALARVANVASRLKGVRVYDAIAGTDAYANAAAGTTATNLGAGPQMAGTVYNRDGQQMNDTNGYRVNAHGGQVIYVDPAEVNSMYLRDGRDNQFSDHCWFWIGEDRSRSGNGTAAFSIYSSPDLYNWTRRGAPLLRGATGGGSFLAAKDGIPGVTTSSTSVYERPKLMYNAKNKTFVVWAHLDGATPRDTTGSYGCAAAGYAVGYALEDVFTYGGRNRMHQYALDSDYVNLAAFPYNSRSQNTNGFGPYWNEQGNNRGFARDMSVYVDDDGTGYIIYASEENRTMFISKLNEDYTALNKLRVTRADEGTEFARINPGFQREAPSVFKYNGKYYMVSSSCYGWSPNGAVYWMADNILGPWEDMGNVMDGSDVPDLGVYPKVGESRLSFGAQSTNVIAVDAEKGHFIYMGDLWGGGGNTNSGYLWLPIRFGYSGTMQVQGVKYWKLEDLENLNRLRITSALPDYYFRTADLPSALNVQVNAYGAGWVSYAAAPVTWDAGNAAKINALRLMEKGELTGYVTVGGKQYAFEVPFVKVTANARYMIDVGSNPEWDPSGSMLFDDYYSTIKAIAPGLKHTLPDQTIKDATTANNFGYTSVLNGSRGSAGAIYKGPTTSRQYDRSGVFVNWWGTPRTTGSVPLDGIGYNMFIDEPGTYTLSFGTYDWWAPLTRDSRLDVSYVNAFGVKVVASMTFRSIFENSFDFTFPVSDLPPGGTMLSVDIIPISQATGSNGSFAPSSGRVENGQPLSWLALALNNPGTVDKSVLQDLVDSVAGITNDSYPNWAAFDAARQAAGALLGGTTATQAQIEAALVALAAEYRPIADAQGATPEFTTAAGALAGATQNAAYNQTLAASSSTRPATYGIVAGKLPRGLSLNPATGAITGTPVGEAGTYAFTVRATSLYGVYDERAFSIAVAGLPFSFNTADIPTGVFPAGTVATAYAPASNGSRVRLASTTNITPVLFEVKESAAIELSPGVYRGLPRGMFLYSNAGTSTTDGTTNLRGTPTHAGTYTFTLMAINRFGDVIEREMSITINEVLQANRTPTLAGRALDDGTVGRPYRAMVVGNTYWSAYIGPVNYELVSGDLPPGLTLADANNGPAGAGLDYNYYALVTGTPTTPGLYTFQVRATGAYASSTATFTITVGEPSDKTALKAAMDAFVALSHTQWTQASWAIAEAAYDEAAIVYGNPAITQDMVNAATAALLAAMDALEAYTFSPGGQSASVVLRKGMTYQINITTESPANVFYVSSNANATVSATGLVTAAKTGSAVITVIDVWAQSYFTVTINITS